MPEKLYPVIFIGIVRSGEDDPGVRSKRSSDISNARCGERTDNENIDPQGRDSRHERILEHVTRKPRVFSEDNFGTRAFRVLPRV